MPLCINVIAPVITRVVNLSLGSGIFPKEFKSAVVKPLLKKPSLDPPDLKNYRPFSVTDIVVNLCSRTLENLHVFKYLGILIDDKLTGSKQVDFVVKKCCQ